MHPNPAFRGEPEFLHLNMVRWRGFGCLIVPRDGDAMPMVSHVPFALDDEGRTAELHLSRGNPIVRAAREEGRPAMLVVSGPDGYVSPDWYEDPTHAQVPTWNYVAVHLTGRLEPEDPAGLRDHLDRLSESFEMRLAPKRPWRSAKMPPAALDRMLRAILPFRLRIEGVEGTWKLSQNKEAGQRDRAASAMRHSPVGHETVALGHMMRGAGPQDLDR